MYISSSQHKHNNNINYCYKIIFLQEGDLDKKEVL